MTMFKEKEDRLKGGQSERYNKEELERGVGRDRPKMLSLIVLTTIFSLPGLMGL